MLLTIDVGNTHSVLGVFRGEDLIAHWRLATQADRTADELGILLRNLFQMRSIPHGEISRAAVACVVPALLGPIEKACRSLFAGQTLVIKPGIRTGMPLLVDNPQEIGADRIANSVGARQRYGVPAVVVDFGTATTFDVITGRGEYAGGLIAPGLRISADALFARAARLPRIEISPPSTLIGTSTIDSMRSGIFYGYLGLVDGILDKLLAELSAGGEKGIDGNWPVHVVATGGLAGEIAHHSRHIQFEDPFLTLYGLKILHEKNAGQ